MRKLYVLLLLFFVLTKTYSQAPGIVWQKNYTESGPFSYFFDIRRTVTGGYLMAGYSSSDLLETARTDGDTDAQSYVLVLDSAGNVIKTFGGMPGVFHSVTPRADGEFIAVGYDYSAIDGTIDVQVMKPGPGGAFSQIIGLWGGSAEDKAWSVYATADNGYILTGHTYSNNGTVSGNHGGADAWVIRVNGSNAIQWAKCLGGTGVEQGFHVTGAPGGGYYIAGYATSNDGDVTGNHGGGDAWLVKLDDAGNIVWQKCYGGTGYDVFKQVYPTGDGGLIAVGSTSSVNGDVTGVHGSNNDVWVVKLDITGNIQWQKCYGGNGDERGINIAEAGDGGFIVNGYCTSNNGDVSGNHGGSDEWVFKISSIGTLEWQQCIGTSLDEAGSGLIVNNEFEYLALANVNTVPSAAVKGVITKLGRFNSIKGSLYVDQNNNGTKDPGEPFYNDAVIKSDRGDGFVRESKPINGLFTNFVDQGTYQTTIKLNNSYYAVTPSSFNSSFSSYFNKDSVGIRLVPVSSINDLQVNLLPLRPSRPGFTASYMINYRNVGTASLSSVTIKLKKDSRCNVISTVPAFSSVNGDTLQWNIANLSALDAGSINITLQVQAPPVANNGDILQFAVIGNPIAGDQTPLDNTDTLYQILVGSYDPNDKTETNGGRITQAQVSNGDYLNYVIRFQNTGNFSAINVDVRDTLNAKLDLNTFEMISSSHTYALNITDGNKLRWTFNNINLPDSNHNEPASHGYIAYRIKPKSTVVVGDTIHNIAGIYFDFNLPVATNNAKTIVFNFSGLPVALVSFNASLHGSAVDVSWKTSAENNAKQFEVQRSTNGSDFATIGIVKAANAPSGQSYLYKDKNPVKGYNYYRLKSVDIDGSSKYSSTVLVNVSDGRDIISSIYPNPSNGQIVFKLQGEINGKVQLSIIDQMGRVVLVKQYETQNTRQLQSDLELGHLSKGTYLLKISIGDKVYNHKFLIQ